MILGFASEELEQLVLKGNSSVYKDFSKDEKMMTKLYSTCNLLNLIDDLSELENIRSFDCSLKSVIKIKENKNTIYLYYKCNGEKIIITNLKKEVQ